MPVTLTAKQLEDALGTFKPTTHIKRTAVPHAAYIDGTRVQTLSGKHVWPSQGAARNALIHHIEGHLQAARYPLGGRYPEGALLSCTLPPDTPSGYRRNIAPAREIVTAMLATGRIKIEPLDAK